MKDFSSIKKEVKGWKKSCEEMIGLHSEGNPQRKYYAGRLDQCNLVLNLIKSYEKGDECK